MRTAMILLLTAGAMVALSGCVTPRKPVVECKFPRVAAPPAGSALVAQEYGAISPIPLDAVQFTDRKLSKELAVQSLQARRTPTNTVLVTARLVNCTDGALVVGARSNFMDGSQGVIEPQTAWQNIVLQPRSMGVYQESSLSKGVERYVVELRDAGN